MSLGEAAPWTYLNTQKNIHDLFLSNETFFTPSQERKKVLYQKKKCLNKEQNSRAHTHKKRTEKHVLVPRSSAHIIQVDFTGRFPGIHPRGSWMDRDRKWKYEWPLYPNSIWCVTSLSWANPGPSAGGGWSEVYIDCARAKRRPTVSPAKFSFNFYL